MKDIVLLSAAILGACGILFGAFGAHALKKILPENLLQNFETGIRYQMYHAIVLLFLGNYLDFHSTLEKFVACSLILGTCLFSFSIYFLCLGKAKNLNLKFIGPITPLGGLLLVAGWSSLIVVFLNSGGI